MINGVSGKEKFDIVFIDPPYSMKITSKILNKLFDLELLNKGAFVICECGDEDCFNGDLTLEEKYEVYRKNRYSISYITVLRPKLGV
jgi:16S rRNA G966 N2-methylase RsmD